MSETQFRTCSNSDCLQPQKPASEFPASGAQCKNCINAKERKRRAERKALEEAAKQQASSNENKTTKICNVCEIEKDITDFRSLRNKCKDCERAHGREYRRGGLGREKAKQWIENNKERMQELQARTYQFNKTEINELNREKYNSDIIYKTYSSMKPIMHSYYCDPIGKEVYNGKLKTTNVIFKKWITFCCDKLNVDKNKSDAKWHFDHVIPVGNYRNNEDEFMVLICWFNISPLDDKKNMEKKSNYDLDQLIYHRKFLSEFITTNNIVCANKEYEKYMNMLNKAVTDCLSEMK